MLQNVRLRLGPLWESSDVIKEDADPDAVSYRLSRLVMAGAEDSVEIVRYSSVEAAYDAARALGGFPGGRPPFSPHSGHFSSYEGGHYQASRWYAWSEDVRVFKATTQFVSTICGDALSPSDPASDLAFEAAMRDLIPMWPVPRPTATCSTPLTARVSTCSSEVPTVRVIGTTEEGECTVKVFGGEKTVTALVTDGLFDLEVSLPVAGRPYRLSTTVKCGLSCTSSRTGGSLTTWRLPASTPTPTATGTLTITPTPTSTATETATPTASPTSYRVLDLAVSADLTRESPLDQRLEGRVENLGPALAVAWDLVVMAEPAGIARLLGEPTISGATISGCMMSDDSERYACRMGPLSPRAAVEIAVNIGHESHGPPESQACVFVTYPPSGVDGHDPEPSNDSRCIRLGLGTGAPPAVIALPFVERRER